MNEFFNMGGYAFYVWSSMAVFGFAMLFDFFSLKMKEKTVKRNIRSYVRRKKK